MDRGRSRSPPTERDADRGKGRMYAENTSLSDDAPRDSGRERSRSPRALDQQAHIPLRDSHGRRIRVEHNPIYEQGPSWDAPADEYSLADEDTPPDDCRAMPEHFAAPPERRPERVGRGLRFMRYPGNVTVVSRSRRSSEAVEKLRNETPQRRPQVARDIYGRILPKSGQIKPYRPLARNAKGQFLPRGVGVAPPPIPLRYRFVIDEQNDVSRLPDFRNIYVPRRRRSYRSAPRNSPNVPINAPNPSPDRQTPLQQQSNTDNRAPVLPASSEELQRIAETMNPDILEEDLWDPEIFDEYNLGADFDIYGDEFGLADPAGPTIFPSLPSWAGTVPRHSHYLSPNYAAETAVLETPVHNIRMPTSSDQVLPQSLDEALAAIQADRPMCRPEIKKNPRSPHRIPGQNDPSFDPMKGDILIRMRRNPATGKILEYYDPLKIPQLETGDKLVRFKYDNRTVYADRIHRLSPLPSSLNITAKLYVFYEIDNDHRQWIYLGRSSQRLRTSGGPAFP